MNVIKLILVIGAILGVFAFSATPAIILLSDWIDADISSTLADCVWAPSDNDVDPSATTREPSVNCSADSLIWVIADPTFAITALMLSLIFA